MIGRPFGPGGRCGLGFCGLRRKKRNMGIDKRRNVMMRRAIVGYYEKSMD